jgi:hypothetical protein
MKKKKMNYPAQNGQGVPSGASSFGGSSSKKRAIPTKITKDTLISEVLLYSGAEKILGKYQVPCLTCPFASIEADSLKLGDVCKSYNIALKPLLKELNRVGKSK